jgi:predicted nucleic acid-binding protein
MSEPANLRVYIDVNIALDLLLHRLPFYHEANQILTLSRRNAITVGISAAAFPFAYFHLRKATGDAGFAREALKKLSTLLELVSIDGEVVRAALEYEQPQDVEDGVQLAAALAFQADVIVTRDKRGFRAADLPVYSPADFLAFYQEHYL